MCCSCSVLQLQCVAVVFRIRRWAVCCSVLQCVAVAVCCSGLSNKEMSSLRRRAICIRTAKYGSKVLPYYLVNPAIKISLLRLNPLDLSWLTFELSWDLMQTHNPTTGTLSPPKPPKKPQQHPLMIFNHAKDITCISILYISILYISILYISSKVYYDFNILSMICIIY